MCRRESLEPGVGLDRYARTPSNMRGIIFFIVMVFYERESK